MDFNNLNNNAEEFNIVGTVAANANQEGFDEMVPNEEAMMYGTQGINGGVDLPLVVEQRPQTAVANKPKSMAQQMMEDDLKQAISGNMRKSQKLSKAAINEQRQNVTEIRNDFLIYLAKVYDKDTRREGVQRCHKIIQTNSDNPQALRVFLAALCDRSTQAAQQQQKNPNSLMFHVQMFGFLAQQFKNNLLDPLDKPPNLTKTVNRIQETIYTFFKERSEHVWEGCGISLSEIYENCFPDKNDPGPQGFVSLFIDPLLQFHSGGFNTMQQQGASFCIKYFVEYFIAKQIQPIIDLIHQPILASTVVNPQSFIDNIYIQKFKVDNEHQLATVMRLIETQGFKIAQPHIDGLISLSIKALNTPSQTNNIKKASCDLLNVLATNLKPVPETVVPFFQKEVLSALDVLLQDKLNAVVEARNKARESWLILENEFNKLDPAKKQIALQQKQELAGQIGNKFSKLREQAKSQKRQESVEKKEDNFVAGQKLVGQNFLKKGGGQGGGNSSSPAQSRDRKLMDELKTISELNALANKGIAGNEEDFKKRLLSVFRPTSAPGIGQGLPINLQNQQIQNLQNPQNVTAGQGFNIGGQLNYIKDNAYNIQYPQNQVSAGIPGQQQINQQLQNLQSQPLTQPLVNQGQQSLLEQAQKFGGDYRQIGSSQINDARQASPLKQNLSQNQPVTTLLSQNANTQPFTNMTQAEVDQEAILAAQFLVKVTGIGSNKEELWKIAEQGDKLLKKNMYQRLENNLSDQDFFKALKQQDEEEKLKKAQLAPLQLSDVQLNNLKQQEFIQKIQSLAQQTSNPEVKQLLITKLNTMGNEAIGSAYQNDQALPQSQQNVQPRDFNQMSPDSKLTMLEQERMRLKQQVQQLKQQQPNLPQYSADDLYNYQNDMQGDQGANHVRFMDSLEPNLAMQLMQNQHQYTNDSNAQDIYVPLPIAEGNQQNQQAIRQSMNNVFQRDEDPDIDNCDYEDQEDFNDRDAQSQHTLQKPSSQLQSANNFYKNANSNVKSEVKPPQPIPSLEEEKIIQLQKVQQKPPPDIRINQPKIQKQQPVQQQKQQPQQPPIQQQEELKQNLNQQQQKQQQNMKQTPQVPTSTQQKQQPPQTLSKPTTPLQQPQPTGQLDPQLTQMISQQILMMQKQMEKGFSLIGEKIQGIESRVDNAASQLEDYEIQQLEQQKAQRQKDQENQSKFRELTDTISNQQHQLQHHITRADQEHLNMLKMTQQQQLQQQQLYQRPPGDLGQGPVQGYDDRSFDGQRENRWRTQEAPYQSALPPIQQSFGNLPAQQTTGRTGGQQQQPQPTSAKSPQRQSKLQQVWNRSMELIKKKQYEEGFRLIMKEGDDMYLLRMVAHTGPVVKYLEDQTAFTVINRINKIMRSGAFEVMEIEWLEDANRRGLFQSLTKYEQNEYLDTLFHFSKSKINPKVSDKASEVYSQIKMSATVSKQKQAPPSYQLNQ